VANLPETWPDVEGTAMPRVIPATFRIVGDFLFSMSKEEAVHTMQGFLVTALKPWYQSVVLTVGLLDYPEERSADVRVHDLTIRACYGSIVVMLEDQNITDEFNRWSEWETFLTVEEDHNGLYSQPKEGVR